jgi:hypothetical protein
VEGKTGVVGGAGYRRGGGRQGARRGQGRAGKGQKGEKGAMRGVCNCCTVGHVKTKVAAAAAAAGSVLLVRCVVYLGSKSWRTTGTAWQETTASGCSGRKN